MKKRREIFFLFSWAMGVAAASAASLPGAIHGFVRFPGETPMPAMYANAGDSACPRGIGQNHLFVNQTTLGLQNALVILDIPEAPSVPVGNATLVSDRCTLSPRIQWVSVGTSLELSSQGGAAHHLRALNVRETAFEVDVPADGSSVRRPLVNTGLYEINCDRHLWERAWIYVSQHSYVALSDKNGEFRIQGVPPGHYHLRVWHEGWIDLGVDAEGRPDRVPMGEELEVKVRSDKTTEVSFEHLERLPLARI